MRRRILISLASLLLILTGTSFIFKQFAICPGMREQLRSLTQNQNVEEYILLKEGPYEAMCQDPSEYILPIGAAIWLSQLMRKKQGS